jgi:hypothetical protein
MISGQWGRRLPKGVHRGCQRWLYGVLVALWGSMTAAAHAQPENFRLVLVQPENSELITRVEGQTRDLGVTLQVAPGGWSSGAAEQAATVAAKHGADFVARIQRSSQGVLEVRVYAVGQRSLRARRVPAHARSDRLTTSAELEAAALVLRGELTALIDAEREAAEARRASDAAPVATGSSGSSDTPPAAAGSTAGGVSSGNRSQQLPSSPPRAKPATSSRPVSEAGEADADQDEARVADEDDEEDEEEPDDEPSEPLESYTVRRSTWTLRGGLRASVPLDSEVTGGALVGARAQVSFLELGLALSTALPVQLADRNVRIRLWRSALTAEALAVIPVGPRLRALLGVDAGVVLYARRTDRVPLGYSAAGSQNAWSATLGAQAELQWLLTRQFGVALGLGLAYIQQRTRFSYTVAAQSQPHEIAALRSFEPHATASLFGLFGE